MWYRINLVKKLIAICLVVCTFSCTAFAKEILWDGFDESSQTEGHHILNTNNLRAILGLSAGVAPSSKVKGNSQFTVHWNNHTVTPSFRISTVPRDWSRYENISFNIYSENATNAQIVITVYCDWEPAPGTTSSYWHYRFNLDWTGWKNFTLNFTDDFEQYNSASLAKVNYMSFNAHGWGSTPSPKSDIYIDSIIGNLADEVATDEVSLNTYTSAQKETFDKASAGVTAVYNYSQNVFSNGVVKLMSSDDGEATTIISNGVPMVPISFFADFLGAEVKENNGEYVIVFENKSISLSTDNIECKVNGVKSTLSVAPILKDELVFVPIEECAIALGKSARTFGELTVIGTDKNIKDFAENPDLVYVGSIVIANSLVDVAAVTSEDFDEIKRKWRQTLVGDETNDINDSLTNNFISRIEQSGQAAWNQMNHGENIKVLFGNTVVSTTAHMTKQYSFLANMAKAYGTYGSRLYKNKKLKADIIYALDWLYDNLYGQDEIDGIGWKSIADGNWWDWYVGVPEQLTETLMILEPELKQSQIDKYLAPFDYIRTVMMTGKDVTSTQPRLYVVTAAAVLLQDAQLLNERMVDFGIMLKPVERLNGVHEDYMYINHFHFPYTGSYGTDVLLSRLVNVASILSGTKFEIANFNKYNIAKWMYNTFEPVTYNSKMMSMVNGRAVSRANSEWGLANTVICAALDLIGTFGPDDDIKLKMLIKRNVTESNLQRIISSLTLHQAKILMDVMEDDTIPEVPYNLAKVYYTGDRVVQQRNGYAVGLAMSSSRIANYESISGENLRGWYTGDGMLYLYNDNSIENNPYGGAFWSNVNPYRMPGTTVDTQERQALSIAGRQEYKSSQDFVGGVQFEDEYTTAAMFLESYHSEVDKGSEVSENGMVPPPMHNSTLFAQKSWFMFDDEVVALGAGIVSKDNVPVLTVVDNRKLNKRIIDEKSSVTEKYDIIGVYASGSDGNEPENMLDGDYETRWSIEGDRECWSVLELDQVRPIGFVGIAQYGATDGKQAIFDIDVSSDGSEWKTVYSGKSSGTTTNMEFIELKDVEARYVRYNGHGRTNSKWNSITEMSIYPPSNDGKTPVTSVAGEGVTYGTEDIYIDGVLQEKLNSYEKRIDNPKWISIEGTGGYYFPNGGKLSINKTNSNPSFYEMWFEHGVNPQNGTYAYVMLPQKTSDETEKYVTSPDVSILANTSSMQVVKENTLGITSMVFWKAGTYGDITASEPLIVMVRELNDEFILSFSDPTQKLEKVSITINKSFNNSESDNSVEISNDGGLTVINADVLNSKGKTYTVKLKK